MKRLVTLGSIVVLGATLAAYQAPQQPPVIGTADKLEVVKLPTPNEGIRKMIVDARGRLWYMGSHSGKLGVVE